MHSITVLVWKKWSRHISKDFVEKVNFEWLDKEFKANEWSDKSKTKYGIPFSIVHTVFRFLYGIPFSILNTVLIVADRIK